MTLLGFLKGLSSTSKIPVKIAEALPQLTKLAQKVYNEWDQNEEGVDEELGCGGICHLIAEEMAAELETQGVDATTVNAQVGENHIWVVARITHGKDAGVWSIDIPPGVYERGSGYVWKKRPNIVFNPENIEVDRLSKNPDDFDEITAD